MPARPPGGAVAPLTALLALVLSACGGGAAIHADIAAGNPATSTSASRERPEEEVSPSTTIAPRPRSEAPTTSSPASPLLAPPSRGASGDPDAPPPPQAEIVSVVRILDGDTLDVLLAAGAVETVRLIGINSPEQGECFYEEGAAALAALIPPGSEGAVTIDTSERDQFGRLLRYLWVGQLSVNEELVRRGAAISRRYPPDVALAARLEQAQAEAMATQRGMWGPEACGPSAEAALSIVEVAYDPPGDDNLMLNEEWVRIRNDGGSVVSLAGWTLKDESASHRYSFPADLSLAPGETATIHTGCGTDFSTDLYWCNEGSAIWNNDGDTAFLLDPSGNIHHSYSYSPPTTTTSPTTTTATPATTTAPAGNCDPSYPTVCIPSPPPDLDCGQVSHRNFTVDGSDPHRFDGDNDGIGCET